MAQSCWKLLGLKKNATERDIKVAYARKLKVTRPEDDPEAFQLLVQARDEALAHARHHHSVTPDKEVEQTDRLATAKTHPKRRNATPRMSRRAKPVDAEGAIVIDVAAPSDAEVEDATDLITKILADRHGPNRSDEFERCFAVLQQADLAQRQSSEAKLAWEIAYLLSEVAESEGSLSASRPLGIAGKHSVMRLAEEFNWIDDEHRVAELAGWNSRHLIAYLHEILYGTQYVPVVSTTAMTWPQKIIGSIVLIYIFSAIGLAILNRLIKWLSATFGQ